MLTVVATQLPFRFRVFSEIMFCFTNSWSGLALTSSSFFCHALNLPV